MQVVIQVVKLIHVASLLIWLGSLCVLIQLIRRGSRWASLSEDSLQELYRKIYLSIDLPFFISAIGTGIFLFLCKDVNAKAGWFHMKMTGMLLLVLCDLWTARTIGIFQKKTLGSARVLQAMYIVALLLTLSAIYVVRDNSMKYLVQK